MKRFRSLLGAVSSGIACAGLFVVMLSSAFGEEYSVRIDQAPQDVTVCEGQSVTLTVQASTNFPNPQYTFQWLDEQGNRISDGGKYSGATTNTLTISNISQAEAGQYTVVVGVSNGQVRPATAIARVTVVPGPTVTQQPQDVTICEGQIAAMSVQVSGGLNVRYQWYANNDPVPGATSSSISQTATAQMNGLQVYCKIISDCGEVNSNTATVTVETAPTITQQPQGGTAAIGQSYQISVQATGTAPLQYQWFKDGQAITGATSNTYTITNVTQNDAGRYKVVVTNRCGTVESQEVQVQAASVEDEAIAAGFRLSVAPMPANGTVTVLVTSPIAASATVEVMDLSGRTVGTIWNGMLSSGEQTLEANVAGMAPGAYRCILRSGTYRLSTPLIIVR
ncbi:MAG: hypothetical protein KatS3mg038_0126 [Candidatus Kapaibacterium sp.]|nr:MAG: hypothetical protein KatS3mg038_0126 [Candidatus Kapabacteria bacterium]